LATEMQVNQGF